MKSYKGYTTTYANDHRGHAIHCCLYHPDILCHIGSNQHGNFWINTDAALVSAKEYIDRKLQEADDDEAKRHGGEWDDYYQNRGKLDE